MIKLLIYKSNKKHLDVTETYIFDSFLAKE